MIKFSEIYRNSPESTTTVLPLLPFPLVHPSSKSILCCWTTILVQFFSQDQFVRSSEIGFQLMRARPQHFYQRTKMTKIVTQNSEKHYFYLGIRNLDIRNHDDGPFYMSWIFMDIFFSIVHKNLFAKHGQGMILNPKTQALKNA